MLGEGSNVVVGGRGLRRARRAHVDDAGSTSAARAIASSSTWRPARRWDALVARAVREGWRGLECMSGIPGLVGATPIQNVGAYGQEVAETIARVRVFDRAAGAFVDMDRARVRLRLPRERLQAKRALRS